MNTQNRNSGTPIVMAIALSSIIVGAIVYGAILRVIEPFPLSDYVRTVLYVFCITLVYTLLKKFLQKRGSFETIVTEQARAEWLRDRNIGLYRYIANTIFRVAGSLTLLSLILPVFHATRDHRLGRLLSLDFVEEIAILFAQLSTFAVGIAVFSWWDNEDNEAEWRRKHN